MSSEVGDAWNEVEEERRVIEHGLVKLNKSRDKVIS